MADKSLTFNVVGGSEFKKANGFLEKCLEVAKFGYLDKYGRRGVAALSAATPKDSGLASSSWVYEIVREDGITSLQFHNTDIENGCNVAILLQYGHATKNGGFVEGIDYINPAIKPIFDEIAKDAWKEMVGR